MRIINFALVLASVFVCLHFAGGPVDDDIFEPHPIAHIVTILNPPVKPLPPIDVGGTKKPDHPPKGPPPPRSPPHVARTGGGSHAPKLTGALATVLGHFDASKMFGDLKPSKGARADLGIGGPMPTHSGPAIGINIGGEGYGDPKKLGAAGVLGQRGFGDGAVLGRVAARPGIGAVRETSLCKLDKDAVRQVIDAHVGQLSSCFEQGLRQHDGLSGTLTAEWAVTNTGSVASARLKSGTLRDAGVVSSCILDVIKHLQFPKASCGEVIVSYPFMFSQHN